MSSQDIAGLGARVKTQYQKAIEAGDAFFFSSDVSSFPDEKIGVDFQVRLVPALLKKPTDAKSQIGDKPAPSSKEETGLEQDAAAASKEQNKKDVFAPPYVPNLLVQELGDHVVLLNKYAVVPHHFLLVTRDFEPQHLPPAPSTLALAYRILQSHASSGGELLGFYNCGAVSGASQPHRHVQFIEVDGPEAEMEGRRGTPMEKLLERIERDGKEYEHVHALPVPWQHFVVLLQPPSTSDLPALESYLAQKLLACLDALFRAKLERIQTSGDGSVRRGPPSFNLLLTRKALHLIPREKEGFEGLAEHVKDAKDGEVGNLSINALAYAGMLLTKSHAELDALRALPGGVITVLKATGAEPVADLTAAAGAPTSDVP